MSSEKTSNFKKHYDKLNEIAERLKGKTETNVDIDALLSDVKQAKESYECCRQRLDNATKELDSIFKETDDDISDADSSE
jgi:exonuclease VII small subunit